MAGAVAAITDAQTDRRQIEFLEGFARQRLNLEQQLLSNRFTLDRHFVDLTHRVTENQRQAFNRQSELREKQLDLASLNFEARENTLREQLASQERLALAQNYSNLFLGNRALDIRERTIAHFLDPNQTFEPAGRETTELLAGQLQAFQHNVPEPGRALENADESRRVLLSAKAFELGTAPTPSSLP